ncbi:DUF1700 domain-containing protein [Candidatus Stoquefichus sp. SB1]|uniref:DUF1700 domain-containing protein n=1 Tax=Candidatus Stoquefichus sp. SB1 TaxID=1658109 RepID=UPI00067F0AF0|nr:DUF1700 domain-containing protein [Candidatus Stoquefichus sp. SB1]
MDRKQFMRELEFLLQDINEDERLEAMAFYENYFDEAGQENEQKVISELGDPARVAAIIKDGLKGHFDEHIYAGSSGFSNDDYSKNYEVIDVDKKEKKKKTSSQKESHVRNRWNEMDSRDRLILIVLAVLACVPFSFSFIGLFKGIFGGAFGLFGIGFSVLIVFLCFIFGFWILTFLFHILAFIFIMMGIFYLFSMPGAGLIYMGIGCFLAGLGTIFGKIASWFFKDCIPTIVNAIADGLSKIFHPRGA